MRHPAMFLAECDSCHLTEEGGVSCYYDGLEEEMPEGWTTRDEKDYCPRCALALPPVPERVRFPITRYEHDGWMMTNEMYRKLYGAVHSDENAPRGTAFMVPSALWEWIPKG